ncbi:hypothetical protein R3P38DRAFT_3069315 [Favolaschia claudopus]|uniref:Uncharacterized protein n=1 Tax=Favolaschia claudopus TaxID=2862362 RepID=A0AAW0A0P9_9AGAR
MRFKFPFSDTLGFTGGKVQRRRDINQALRQLLSFLNPLPYNAVLSRDHLGHALAGARQNVGHQGLDHFAGWFHYCDETVHVDCKEPYQAITPARHDLLHHPEVKNLLHARAEVAPTPRKPASYPNSVRIRSRSSPTPLGRRTRFQKPVSSIAGSSQPRSHPHTRIRKTRFGQPLNSDGGETSQTASWPPLSRPPISPIDYNPGTIFIPVTYQTRLRPHPILHLKERIAQSSPINPVDPEFLKYLAAYAFGNTTTTPTRAIQTVSKPITPTSASSKAPHYSPDGFILRQLSQANSENPFGNANSPISISSGSSSPLNLSSDTDLELGYPPEVVKADMTVRLAIFHPVNEAIHGLWLADHSSLLQKQAGFNVEAPFEWFDLFRGQWLEKKGSEPFPIPYNNYILFIRPAGVIANVDAFLNQIFQ